MQLPTAKDWSLMRTTLTVFMPDVIQVYSITTTYNEYGQPSQARTLTTTISGQLSAATGTELQHVNDIISSDAVNEGVENTEVMHLVLPYSATLTTEQEVTTADGKNWQVTMSNDSQTFTAAKEYTLYRHLISNQEVP